MSSYSCFDSLNSRALRRVAPAAALWLVSSCLLPLLQANVVAGAEAKPAPLNIVLTMADENDQPMLKSSDFPVFLALPVFSWPGTT